MQKKKKLSQVKLKIIKNTIILTCNQYKISINNFFCT